MALTLSARAEQTFVTAYFAHKNDAPADVERIVKANAAVREKAQNCRWYVYGANYTLPGWEEREKIVMKDTSEEIALFTNTPERLRNYKDAERPLVATGGQVLSYEEQGHECFDLGFDPNNYPN
jgi:hypothetical protein